MSKSRCTRIAAVTASNMQGRKANLARVNFSFLSADVFNPSPERIRMTTKAILRSDEDHRLSM